jgi:TrmH family RNA methyltransferase
MATERITSLQNPHVKQLVRLRDRRPRDATGQFLIEGFREVKRALEAGVKPVEFYYGPDWFLGDNEPALIEEARLTGAQLFELSKEAFAKVSYRDRPDGLLVVAPQWKRTLADLNVAGLAEDGPGPPAAKPPLLLVVEAIEKPGNLGTLLRGADAAGVDAVVVCDPVTDIFNPNVVRSSTGVLFSMPVIVAESSEVRSWLRTRGIRAVATTPAAPALYTDADLRGPLAIIMGSEQYGLSGFWLKESDLLVRIPMAGQADSLNVAMAAIITLFEAGRQRGRQPGG